MREPPDDLSGFPARTLAVGTPLHRVHRAKPDLRSWLHFSSDLSGRFDVERIGTLYTAEAPVGALLETARGLTLLSPEWRAARRLTTTRLVRVVRVADTTHPRAYSYGVTNELSATPDYALAQRWAVAFATGGFNGIRYVARHDVACREVAVALFASATVRAALDADGATTEPVPDEVVAAARAYGIRAADHLPDSGEEEPERGSATA